MKPLALKHAMYFAPLLGALFCLNFYLSALNTVWSNAMSWIPTLLIPYLAYRLTCDCRDRVYDGIMSYGACVWYGIQLFFYASLIAAVFKYLYFKVIAPDFIPNLMEQTTALMEQMEAVTNKTDVETIEAVKKTLTPINLTMAYVWIDLLAGCIVSLVVAAFARRKNSLATPTDEQTL